MKPNSGRGERGEGRLMSADTFGGRARLLPFPLPSPFSPLPFLES
jgi:hypothetical protein